MIINSNSLSLMSANHLKLGIHSKKEIDILPKKNSKILVLETNKKQTKTKTKKKRKMIKKQKNVAIIVKNKFTLKAVATQREFLGLPYNSNSS